MKVSFLIAGTQKGGTTALDAILRQHPNICMALRTDHGADAGRKEAHFFDNDSLFAGTPNYSLYHRMFSPKQGETMFGDATPIYMYWYDAPRRIWQYNKEMRIILLLRNPVDRAYSHWNMERARGAEVLSFSEAISAESQRCRAALPLQHRVFSYVDRGFYIDQIRRLWSYFPKDQILILKSEEMRRDPLATTRKVCDFLNLPQFSPTTTNDHHVGKYQQDMPAECRDILTRRYFFSIRELEMLLDWDCRDWLTNTSVAADGYTHEN